MDKVEYVFYIDRVGDNIQEMSFTYAICKWKPIVHHVSFFIQQVPYQII